MGIDMGRRCQPIFALSHFQYFATGVLMTRIAEKVASFNLSTTSNMEL